jgi:hypothetical protein
MSAEKIVKMSAKKLVKMSAKVQKNVVNGRYMSRVGEQTARACLINTGVHNASKAWLMDKTSETTDAEKDAEKDEWAVVAVEAWRIWELLL